MILKITFRFTDPIPKFFKMKISTCACGGRCSFGTNQDIFILKNIGIYRAPGLNRKIFMKSAIRGDRDSIK